MRPGDLPELRERMLARMADLQGVIESATRVGIEAEEERLALHGASAADLRRHGLKGREVSLDRMVSEASELAARQVATAEQLRTLSFGPKMMHSHWRMGDLFWVSGEMCEVAVQAAETMPAFRLDPADLPSPSGVMYFDFEQLQATYDGQAPKPGEKPLDLFDLTAVWGPDLSPGEDRMDVVLTLQADVHRGAGDPAVLYQVRMGYGEGRLWVSSDNAGPWPKIVVCAWLLMQQRVASVEVARPDRASARRIVRRGGRVDPVRVIRLRSVGGEREPGESDRVYSHRWVVRGHWRKQWYASQGRHVPIWISPFIKGPDDAPLLGGEKVYAWTR